MRTAEITRRTNETNVRVFLNLDGTGKAEINSGVGFLDHMLTLFASHARFDLSVSCEGDTSVDDHHSVEDIGVALGQAMLAALKEKRGVVRYGFFLLPMDEALVETAVDFSGRGFLRFTLALPSQKVGTFDTELVREFFAAFAREGKLTLHIEGRAGDNCHHIIEAAFKGAGRALKAAVQIDSSLGGEIPSTKGSLS